MPQPTTEDLNRVFEAASDAAAAARMRWTSLDRTNTPDQFITYSLAYIGRATSAERNSLDIATGIVGGRREMLVKAIGLLAEAAARLP